MVPVSFIRQPSIGREDKVRFEYPYVLEKIASQVEVAILARVRVTEPVLFLHANDSPRRELIAFQSLCCILVGRGHIHNPHEIVRCGEIEQFCAITCELRENTCCSAVVVIIMRLDAKDALCRKKIWDREDGFDGHAIFNSYTFHEMYSLAHQRKETFQF